LLKFSQQQPKWNRQSRNGHTHNAPEKCISPPFKKKNEEKQKKDRGKMPVREITAAPLIIPPTVSSWRSHTMTGESSPYFSLPHLEEPPQLSLV
jgi:hypothetical protein